MIIKKIFFFHGVERGGGEGTRGREFTKSLNIFLFFGRLGGGGGAGLEGAEIKVFFFFKYESKFKIIKKIFFLVEGEGGGDWEGGGRVGWRELK